MKLRILRAILMLKSKVRFGMKGMSKDSLIEENNELIKQIRMNRMKFYRFHKKAETVA